MTKLLNSLGQPMISKRAGLSMMSGDIIALIVSFWVCSLAFNYLTALDIQTAQSYERHVVYGLIGLSALIVFLTNGHYTQRMPWWNQVRILALTTFFSLLAEGFISFMVGIQSSGILICANWLLCLVLFIILRLVFFNDQKRLKDWSIPTVIIGDSSTASDILYAFNADPSTGYDVKTVFLRDREGEKLTVDSLPKRYSNLEIVGDTEDYASFIRQHPDYFFVVVLDTFRGLKRDLIIENLNKAKAHYAVVPAVARLSLYEMEPRYFFGFDVMLLHARTALTSPMSHFVKRAMDFSAAGLGLLLLSPFFAVIIAALKIEGQQGSIFYGGERIGQNGRRFNCWKFRTMAPDSDHLLHEYLAANPEAQAHWEKYRKLPKDPRVRTRTESFLRKASLDELPQLWNVLTGDMSLVGPRPILPNEQEAYGATLNEYIKVRPGITGLWQVSGRNAMSFERRVYWDSWYVRNWSLWGDIVIMLKTVPAVLLRNDGH